MRTTLYTLTALTVGIALAGCPSAPVDKDANPASATLPQITTKLDATGNIDAKKNKVDWKIMTAPLSGDAELKVTFVDDHKLTGNAGVYGALAAGEKAPEKIVSKSISTGQSSYKLVWPVEAGRTYLFKIEAAEGGADYNVSSLSVTEPEPEDPCLGVECDDGQECKAGECVEEASQICKPACRGGKSCVDGTCQAPCGGGCARGQVCSRSKNECVKDPCFGKSCASGERCYGGSCRAVAVKKPCDGKCASDEKCVSNKCEKPATADAPTATGGPIKGSIVQLLPDGGKTTIFINLGSVKGVKIGMTGSIAGVPGSFKIVEVYDFRCKATIGVDEKTIGANKSVTIN